MKTTTGMVWVVTLIGSPSLGCSAAGGAPSPEARTTGSVSAAVTSAPAGTLDTSFGAGGTVVAQVGFGAGPAALQSNGDIIVAGSINDSVIGVARFTASGSLDTTFGQNGVAQLVLDTADAEFDDTLTAMGIAVQSSGSIDIALTDAPDGSGCQFAVAQFTSSGALDTSFGTGGVVQVPLVGVSDGVDVLLAQPNGQLLVAGSAFLGGGKKQGLKNEGVLVRLNKNGSLDTTFGKGGVVTSSDGSPQAGAFRFPVAVALDGSGDIFVLDNTTSPVTLSEFTSAGVSLTALADGGSAAASLDGSFGSISPTNPLFAPNGDFYTSSGARGATKKTVLVQIERFLLSGAADSTFSNSPFSYSTPQPINMSSTAPALLLSSNGNLVVGGGAPFLGDGSSGDHFALAEIEPSGALEPSFGSGGAVVTTSLVGSVSVLLQQSSGDIVAVGSANGGLALARYVGP